jgi:hypothetical protein
MKKGKALFGLLLIAATCLGLSCKKEKEETIVDEPFTGTRRIIAIMPVEIGEITPSIVSDSSRSEKSLKESIQLANTYARQVRGLVTQGLMERNDKRKFGIVDTSQIDKIIVQHDFEMSDWSDSNKVAEVGKAFNADVVCIAVLNGKELDGYSGEIMVAISFLDVNTMEVLGSFSKIYEKRDINNKDIGNLPADIKVMTLDL